MHIQNLLTTHQVFLSSLPLLSTLTTPFPRSSTISLKSLTTHSLSHTHHYSLLLSTITTYHSPSHSRSFNIHHHLSSLSVNKIYTFLNRLVPQVEKIVFMQKEFEVTSFFQICSSTPLTPSSTTFPIVSEREFTFTSSGQYGSREEENTRIYYTIWCRLLLKITWGKEFGNS